MVYTNTTHITSIEDVVLFFTHLVDEKHICFHPDDGFEGNFDNLTVLETKNYDRLMDECFAVCEEIGEDIYALALDIIKPKLKE